MKLIRYQYPQASTALDRLFDFGSPAFGRFGSIFDDLFSNPPAYVQAAADLYEDEHNYYARLELPGFKKDELELELENAVLAISSVKNEKSEVLETCSSFRRSISVPDDVNSAKVSAELKDGLLTVTLPKVEGSKPRQITVD
ncbi:MAG: Hsp20/alpha crystallin family protein [Verrucomicrobiota bacterium]